MSVFSDECQDSPARAHLVSDQVRPTAQGGERWSLGSLTCNCRPGCLFYFRRNAESGLRFQLTWPTPPWQLQMDAQERTLRLIFISCPLAALSLSYSNDARVLQPLCRRKKSPSLINKMFRLSKNQLLSDTRSLIPLILNKHQSCSSPMQYRPYYAYSAGTSDFAHTNLSLGNFPHNITR